MINKYSLSLSQRSWPARPVYGEYRRLRAESRIAGMEVAQPEAFKAMSAEAQKKWNRG
jgi:hypothetical protein